MADTKASAFAALTGANLDPAADLIPVVDVSAGASGNKVITPNQLRKVIGGLESNVAHFDANGSSGDGTPGNPYGPTQQQTAWNAGFRTFDIGAGCTLGNLSITATATLRLLGKGRLSSLIGDITASPGITLTVDDVNQGVTVADLVGGVGTEFVLNNPSVTSGVTTLGGAVTITGNFDIIGSVTTTGADGAANTQGGTAGTVTVTGDGVIAALAVFGGIGGETTGDGGGSATVIVSGRVSIPVIFADGGQGASAGNGGNAGAIYLDGNCYVSTLLRAPGGTGVVPGADGTITARACARIPTPTSGTLTAVGAIVNGLFVIGPTPEADNTYTVGLGAGSDGTITMVNGVPTAITQAS